MSGQNGFVPTPADDSVSGADQDSIDAWRTKLREQRAKQRACLERQRKTAKTAVESVRSGTTYYDPEKLKRTLEEEGK